MITCQICGEASRVFHSEEAARKHSLVHLSGELGEDFFRFCFPLHAPSIYPCPLCDQECFSEQGIEKHLKDWHMPTIYLCPICGKDCFSDKNIQGHIKNDHIVKKFEWKNFFVNLFLDKF